MAGNHYDHMERETVGRCSEIFKIGNNIARISRHKKLFLIFNDNVKYKVV